MRKAGSITDSTCTQQTEVIVILMSLGWVYEVRTDEVVICSDSMAVLMSLQSLQTNTSDILSVIIITLYSIKQIP